MSLTGRNEFFLNPPRASLSATYFQRRPSNSSQQMIPTMGDGGGGASRRGVEAKLALIRIVSRTRISLLAMVVVVEFADCFIGFGAITLTEIKFPISLPCLHDVALLGLLLSLPRCYAACHAHHSKPYIYSLIQLQITSTILRTYI